MTIAYDGDTAAIGGGQIDRADIEDLDRRLMDYFRDVLVVHPELSRTWVSARANKHLPGYRWFPYREAFSAPLVEYFVTTLQVSGDTVLDPFAGSGTTLFAARDMGFHAVGIEVLPLGQTVISTRAMIESELTDADVARLSQWATDRLWEHWPDSYRLPELRITHGAYPKETQEAIERYIAAYHQENERVAAVLRFALLCIAETISFTRKDGLCLRWDHRSGRSRGNRRFEKGPMIPFSQALSAKLHEILTDRAVIVQSHRIRPPGAIRLLPGSAFTCLPHVPDASVDAIITSPPYCNRCDYTRMYALELALLHIDDRELCRLRRELIHCTLEHRPRDLGTMNPRWQTAIAAVDRHDLLQAILAYLNQQHRQGRLNSPGIPAMVRGYVYELACLIAECIRVLRPHAPLVMVNDNVRYAGVAISLDLILSQIAEQLGCSVEHIFVLPTAKGNSSQQMRTYGRVPLRKCVYVWRKR